MFSSPWPALIVAAVVVAHLVLAVFPRFSYDIAGGALAIRRFILGRVPFGGWHVNLAEVLEARRSVLWIPWRARILGGSYSTRGVVLVLKPRRFRVWRAIYVTPENPEQFVQQINRTLGVRRTKLTSQERYTRPALTRKVPVWLGHVVAVLSGMSTALALTHGGYLETVRTLVEFFGPSPAGRALAVASNALIVLMSFWMIVDCFGEFRRTQWPRFAAWLAAMFLFYPTSWFYYVIEWRPGRVLLSKGRTRASVAAHGRQGQDADV